MTDSTMNSTTLTTNQWLMAGGQTVFHVPGLHGADDAAALAAKLSGLRGVKQVRCVAGTQIMTIAHDPVLVPVELILWVVRDTGRRAIVLHRAEGGPRWHWPAMTGAALGVIVLLCHWTGLPWWLEMGVLLAAVATAVWPFVPTKGKLPDRRKRVPMKDSFGPWRWS